MKRVLYLFGQLQDRDIEWMLATGKKLLLVDGAEFPILELRELDITPVAAATV